MKQILSLSLFLALIISCKTETCAGTEHIDGITFKNGKPYTGKCITHWQDFSTRSIKEYKNGLDHGEWTFYYQNGNFQTTGSFFEGKRIGEWKYFYESGKLWKQHLYNANGNPEGKWFTFNKEGQKIDSTLH